MDAVLVDAAAAMRHIEFAGRLYHRSDSAWVGPIDLTRSRPASALGPGFYTCTERSPPTFSTRNGPYLMLLELPPDAFEGKTALVTNYAHQGDKQGASLTVSVPQQFVVIHDTDLLDAATLHPFWTSREVFPTSPPK